ASNFAISDRWYSPMPGNSRPSRVFLYAATTHGYAHTPPQIPVTNIFELLQNAGVSWKVYYQATINGNPVTALSHFQPFESQHRANIQPLSQYFADLSGGTLPQVAFIEQKGGLDEH